MTTAGSPTPPAPVTVTSAGSLTPPAPVTSAAPTTAVFTPEEVTSILRDLVTAVQGIHLRGTPAGRLYRCCTCPGTRYPRRSSGPIRRSSLRPHPSTVLAAVARAGSRGATRASRARPSGAVAALARAAPSRANRAARAGPAPTGAAQLRTGPVHTGRPPDPAGPLRFDHVFTAAQPVSPAVIRHTRPRRPHPGGGVRGVRDLTQAVQEIRLFLAGSYEPHPAAPSIATTAPLWQPPHQAASAALARLLQQPLHLPSTATTAPPWLQWQPPLLAAFTMPPWLPPHQATFVAPPWQPPHQAASAAPPWQPPLLAASTMPPWLPPHQATFVAPPWQPPHQAASAAPPWQPPLLAASTMPPWLPPHQATFVAPPWQPPHHAASAAPPWQPPYQAASTALAGPL
nr:proline-rich protein 36-like [Aegilops tauschii subsp. strangulata]